MGRTVRTASMLISEESSRWRDFRAALRQRDREAFDRLTAYSRRHFSAISNSGIIDPFEVVALSIFLEVEKRLEALENERHTAGLCSPGELDSSLDKDRTGDGEVREPLHCEDISAGGRQQKSYRSPRC